MRHTFQFIAVLFLCVAPLLAQDEIPTRVTNQNRMGPLPYSTSVGSDIEQVDLATGALHVNIPIWSVPGRGMDASLSFHWNSNYLIAAARTDSLGRGFFTYAIARDSGWQSNHPYFTVASFSAPCSEGIVNGQPPRTVLWINSHIYYDEEGGQHPLAMTTGGGACTPGQNSSYPDLTASGMQGTLSPFGVVTSDGTSVGASTEIPINPLTSNAATYKDANGNTRASNTDTLGRALYTAVDAPFDANQRPTQTTFTVKDPNGVSQNIVVVWQPLTIATQFGTSEVIDASGLGWYAISSITFQNGTAYHFQYEPDYGELTEIDLPSGGVIKYTWANYTYPNPASETPSQESRRYVASRTEIVNGVTNTWNFQLSPDATAGYDDSTVTYPLVHTPSGGTIQNQSVFVSWLGNVLDARIYNGAATGTPVREYFMNYTWDADPSGDSSCTSTDAPANFPLPAGVRMTRLITVLDNGQASKKEFTYDQFTYTAYPNHCSTKADSSVAVTETASRGNVTGIAEYGFGTASGTLLNMDVPNATLLRTTTRTYWHDTHPAYQTANIVDKIASEIVTDNVNNLTASQMQVQYDQTAITPTLNLGSVPAHDSNFTSAVTTRGNPTQVSRWNNADGTQVTTTYNYDDLGNLRSIQDPNGNTTSWLYDDSFDAATNTCPPSANSFAYVSKKTDAAGHNFFVTRRACTGSLNSHQDDNDVAAGVKTLYTYDLMGRVLITSLPDGGSGTNDYHNDVAPPMVSLTTAAAPDPDITRETDYDGLHRVVKTLLAGGEIVDTVYDAYGRIYTVSNPHGAIGSPTDGTTTTVYDAISRPLQVTKQDGGIVTYSYSGTQTTVTDESGRQRSTYADALGRLVQVDEEATQQIPDQPAAPAKAGTGSVTISGAEQSQQTQTVPGNKSSASITMSGSVKTMQAPDCPLHQSCPIYDTGDVWITVNGVTAVASYAHPDTLLAVVQRLVNAINTKAGMPVTATNSSNLITITSVNPGSTTNYSFSTGTDFDSGDGFSSPSFSFNPVSGTMTGGTDPQFTTSYDSGTTSVVINGQTYSVSWGQGATASGIAGSLATVITAGTLANASASGGTITLTAKATGASTNYSLSASSSSPLNSFTAAASGSTLTGGADATPDIPAHSVWQGVWTTKYAYDALGNLFCVEQHGNATGTPCPIAPFSPTSIPVAPDPNNPWRLRRFAYNSLSELVWASNPEGGVISYLYDSDGNVSQKTSPKHNQTGTATTAITYCYDSLSRLLAKGYTDSPSVPPQCSKTPPYLPSPAVVNTYDAGTNGIGRLTSLTDQAGGGIYTYDIMGRIKTQQRTTAGQTKSFVYHYDLAGFPNKITYPSTRVVNYTADAAGRPLSAIDGNGTSYASTVSYNAAGSLAGYVNAASITSSFLYNPRLQLCRITAFTSGSVSPSCDDSGSHGNLLDRSYNFSLGAGDNGNVLGITNYRDTSRSQSFTYDSVNRIVTGATSGGTGALAWGENYTLDAWGNLMIGQMPGKPNGGNFPCAGDNLNHATCLSYDAAGNVTANGTASFSFDQENRLTSAVRSTYAYDSDGNRVEKSGSTANTLYWYGTPGILAESDLSGNLTSEYIFFAGKRIARVDSPAGTVHYYLSDHLSSTSMVVSTSGAPEEESDYSPFGTEYKITSGPNHYKFTSKERDTETQLDYFGARYYSRGMGRFISADFSDAAEAVPYATFGQPQSLNQYSYATNNPLNSFDEDGHSSDFSLTPAEVFRCTGMCAKPTPTPTPTPPPPPSNPLFDPDAKMHPCEMACGEEMFERLLRLLNSVNQLFSGQVSVPATQQMNTLTPPVSIDPKKLELLLKVISVIDATGNPPAGTKGGGNFANDGRNGGQVLPPTDSHGNPITYKEWDVHPTPATGGRGTERIVTGSDGSAWYTGDHYQTFTKMR